MWFVKVIVLRFCIIGQNPPTLQICIRPSWCLYNCTTVQILLLYSTAVELGKATSLNKCCIYLDFARINNLSENEVHLGFNFKRTLLSDIVMVQKETH